MSIDNMPKPSKEINKNSRKDLQWQKEEETKKNRKGQDKDPDSLN